MKIHLRTCVNLSSARMREKKERQSRAILSKKGWSTLNINVNTDSGVWSVSFQEAAALCFSISCWMRPKRFADLENCLYSATEFEFRGSSCEKGESWDSQGGGGVSEGLWSAGNNDAVNS